MSPIGRIGERPSTTSTTHVDQNTPATPVTEPAAAPAADGPHLEAAAPTGPNVSPSGSQNKGLTTTDTAAQPHVEADTQPSVGLGKHVSEFIGKWKAEEKSGPLKGIIGIVSGEGAGVSEFVKDKVDRSAVASQIGANVGWAVRTGIQVDRAIINPLVSISDKVKKAVDSGKAVDAAYKVSGFSKELGQGFNAAGAALSFASTAKTAVELVRDVAGDVAAFNDRTEMAKLLEGYDPVTHTLKDEQGNFTIPASTESVVDGEKVVTHHPKYERIHELMNAKGADRSRSHGQAVCDRLTQVKDMGLTGSSGVAAVISTVGKSALAASAANAVPGVGAAVAFISAGHATYKAAVNITAINNVRKAEDNAKDDPFLKAISSHIKQERLHNSRTNLANATANAVSASLQTAAIASAGPAVVIAGACGAGLVAGVALGVAAFEMGHKATLAQRREGGAEKFKQFEAQLKQEGADKAKLMASLSDGSKIGVAEHALLKRLRGDEGPQAREAAVKFLTDFGLTKGTIVKLQTKPFNAAMESMQAALYTDKVKWNASAAFHYSLGTLGRVVGIVQAGRAIKKGFEKLADKITASVTPKPGSGIELVGASNVRGGLQSTQKVSLQDIRSTFKLQALSASSTSVGGVRRTSEHSRVNEELNAVSKRKSVFDLPQVRSFASDPDDLEVDYRATASS
jgi:hypothetical protein